MFLRWPLSSLPVASLLLTYVDAFSLSACSSAVLTAVNQTPSILNDSSLFFTPPTNLSNIVLTLNGCEELCGGNNSAIDNDSGPRLFQWVFPVVILIGSIQTPPLAPWKCFWCMLRFIGDPVDALLSIICMLHSYSRCYGDSEELAEILARRLTESGRGLGDGLTLATGIAIANGQHLRRCFAFTMSAITYLNPSTTLNEVRHSMQELIPPSAHRQPVASPGPSTTRTLGVQEFEILLINTAGRIAANRSREMWKAYNAVFWCVAGLVVAVVPQDSGSPSGAMLASALALSPLFFFVLLSNSLGENKSNYELHRAIKEFLEGCSAARVERFERLRRGLTDSRYLDKLLYTTGISCYQPQKFLALGQHTKSLMGWDGILLLTVLLIFPASLAAAAGAIAGPPAYFNDRDFVMVGIFVIWVLSAVTTALLSRYCREPELCWRLVAAKDTVVATAVSASLAGITCGWLSSCRMWAGVYRYGKANARVYLNPVEDFRWNNHVLYPTLVAVWLGVNILAYFGVRGVLYQSFQVISWNDGDISDALRKGEDEEAADYGNGVHVIPGEGEAAMMMGQ